MATFKIKRVGSDRAYTVNGGDWMTLDQVWLSEKCWFGPGSRVTISDGNGNSKTFTKEKLSGIAGAMLGRR